MIIPFEPEHLKMMANFGGQEQLAFSISQEELQQVKARGHCYTFVKKDTVLGCAGVTGINKFRAGTWGIFQKTSPNDFVTVHKHTVWMINSTPFKRIEAYVDPRLKQAVRWIEMLGFALERDVVPYYFPDGHYAMEWIYSPCHS